MTDTRLDVFIPAHAKDFPVLPRCIRALRRFLQPAVGTITVVCQESAAELQACIRDDQVICLPEGSIRNLIPKSAVPPFRWNGLDRTGWYYQQLVKYALRQHVDSPRYLVIDADTVLVAPTRFNTDNRYTFYRSTQFHEPYFRTFEKLLGERPERLPSFIADYMVFDVALLEEMLGKIAGRHPGKSWDEAILNAIEPGEQSSFSEFETYGYYLSRAHPDRFVSVPVRYTTKPRKRLKLAWWDAQVARLKGVNSISYHHYL